LFSHAFRHEAVSKRLAIRPDGLGRAGFALAFREKGGSRSSGELAAVFSDPLLSHVPGACAAAEPIENAVNKTASMSRVISLLHPERTERLREARVKRASVIVFYCSLQ
jgi:hypothetical protein